MEQFIENQVVYGRDLNKAQYSELVYRSGIDVTSTDTPDQIAIAENPSFGLPKGCIETFEVSVGSGIEHGSIECELPEEDVVYGTEVSALAVADDNYHLEEWSDGATENPHTFVITDTTEISATFAIDTFAVTSNVIPENAGTIEVSPESPVEYGTEITLTVTKAEGYNLESLMAGDSPITVIEGVGTYAVTSDVTIIANFVAVNTPEQPGE